MKDWELHLALQDPQDPIHDDIERALRADDERREREAQTGEPAPRARDDWPNPWRIQVRGHPARVRGAGWREAIREAVTAAYPQAPFPSPPEGTKFSVEMILRMTPKDLARACDLDNFAKPVLDTLFTSQNVTRLNGVLLPGVNDTWVFRLVLEKIGVKTPQEQGADITVTWHPWGTPDLRTS